MDFVDFVDFDLAGPVTKCDKGGVG